MNFDFSEGQKLIQSEARKFLRERCSNEQVRQVMDEASKQLDAGLWQEIVKLGWTGLAIDEQYNGHALGYLEMCLVAQELGRSLAPVPFASTVYLAAETIKLAGNAEQKQRLLGHIAKGEKLGCLAVIEESGQTIRHAPQSRFIGGKISGTKSAITDGGVADFAIVSALNEQSEYSLFIVDLNQAGVTKTITNSLDPSRPCADLTFKDVGAEHLGEIGQAASILKRVYNLAAVLIAFEQVGGCQAALKMGMSYTKQRYAFGRPVASFQAIKHKFADMYVAAEIAQANAYYAAWALSISDEQQDAPELALAAATARVSAIDAYFLCSKENLQAHGGMGYTWELDCHLHYRRAQHLSLCLGSAHYWKDQITQELLLEHDRLNLVENF